jgi:DNA-binding NtrC family response regulator
MSTTRVRVVEDEVLVLIEIADTLEAAGYSVNTATSITRALAQVARNDFDVVVLDYNLAGELATPVAAVLTERKIPYIICSGYAASDDSTWSNASMQIVKPCEPTAILDAVRSLSGEVPDESAKSEDLPRPDLC